MATGVSIILEALAAIAPASVTTLTSAAIAIVATTIIMTTISAAMASTVTDRPASA
jgi:hypothetical protein